MNKQYKTEKAHTDDFWVFKYIDGKYEDCKLVSCNELDKYLSWIEENGYKKECE